jgi:hypothetical protein
LIFLRLPPAFGLHDGADAAYHDQFLAGPSPESGLPIHEKPSEVDPLSEEIQRVPPRFDHLASSMVGSLDELFSGRNWFSYVPPTTQDRQIQLELATNATRQLVHTAKIEPLAHYYLGLCAAKDGTRVKKPAKALLKQYPNNLSLYGAYGLAEFANNNHDIATKVLSSATELASVRISVFHCDCLSNIDCRIRRTQAHSHSGEYGLGWNLNLETRIWRSEGFVHQWIRH